MRKHVFVLTLLSLSLAFVGCNRENGPTKATDLSALGAYISGFVPGAISSQDPVRIRFARPVVPDSLVGANVEAQLYKLSPSVPGNAIWEDVYTFRFSPDKGFTPGTTYSLDIALGKLFPEIDPAYKTATFNFSVKPVQMHVSVSPAGPSEEDGMTQEVQGNVRTSESVEAGTIEKALTVVYAGGTPAVHWNHAPDGRTHDFTLSGLRRGQKDEKLTVSWDGKDMHSPSKGSSTVVVPAIGVFKTTGVTILQDGTHEVQIAFSDYLDPNFNLTGMVRVNSQDKGFETRRSKNVLSIFPADDIAGEFTVSLDAAIRSTDGKTLGTPEVFSLSFEDMPPQVELLGKGNIVPHSSEVILPFKAINLRAVDIEIFEIFENNVLQFLQYSDLWYANGYESVGRVVGTHVLNLGDQQSGNTHNQWQRYAVDLSHYTDIHPGSIYEVRIGFKKEYSQYNCPASSEETTEATLSYPSESIWQYYYDYDEYSYENREDPCMHEYFTAEHFVRRNVLASNLGITANSENNNDLKISVHDLRTTSTVSGCKIAVYDFQQQLLAQASTGSDGSVRITSPREPAFVIAEYQNEKGYLKVTDGNALNMSDFDISGASPKNGMQGFIYGERDVWRPGDTVFLNFVLEAEEGANADHPVTCTVFNPRGQKRFEQTRSTHVGPIYSFPIATDPADLTGNWRAEFAVGGAKFNKTVKIETIKPNRLKINIDHDGPVQAWTKETVLPLSVQWLHGAPAAGLQATVELGLSPVETRFKGYSEFVFDDPARKVDPAVTTVFDGKLDASGNARIIIPHDQQQLLPGKMRANIKTRAFEQGGDFSTDQFSAEWQPYSAYAGLSIPTNRWGYQQLEEGAENTIRLVSVDPDGKGLANRELSVGVYQADWSWWWNDNRYELAQYNSAQHLGAFIQKNVTTNAKGEAEFSFTPASYGLYLIRVCDVKSGHCSGDYAYAGYYYGDEDDGRNAVAKLTFTTDKESYVAGEPVQLSIPSSTGSLVIVNIENDHRVVSTQEIMANGDVTVYTFTADATMAPNVYAHVSLVQPHNAGENDLPLRMYGVLPVLVENPASRLQPVIAMPDVIKPEQEFEISVSEQGKQGMAYTIDIVDEGLLDLTRFHTPDPWNAFYAKQALGVRTWDVYDNVLGALGGPVERILAIGGDGSGVQIQAVNEVNRFKPVVMHLGPFYLKPGAKDTHKLVMPNYVGSVRAMVVAAAADSKYGNAEKAVPVKSPVMILATMPRVLAPGEELAIPVNVFAMDDKIRNVNVTVKGNNNIAITGAATKSVSFDKQGDKLLTFSADVAQQIGKGEVTIEAVAGSEKATQRIEIAIRNPNPYISDVMEIVVEKGKTWEGQIEDLGMPGTNEATLEMSLLFPANLDKRLSYLIHYPYGCLEQTTSSAFPQLYVNQLIELSPDVAAQVQNNVHAAVMRITRFINPAGGFSYWPGNREVNEWTNSYAGHFLIEAQRAGYYVDPSLLEHWKAFQVTRAQKFLAKDVQTADFMNQAYRLYTLALAGSPELGAMNRLRTTKDLPGTARYMLAAAYANSGQTTIAKELVAKPAEITEYASAGYTYGSATRDRALIVEALIATGDEDKALPIVKRIADELASGSWYSTQTTAYALIALSRFAAKQSTSELYFAYKAGGIEKKTVRQSKPMFQERIAEGKPRGVLVENLSDGPLYLRVIRRGRPVEPVTSAVTSNLNMQVTYQDMDGKTIDPSRLSQGTDFVMTVTIGNPATYAGNLDEVALQNIFPSGWEIINQRLDNLGDRFKNSDFEYQDIRDDRVYTFFDLYGKTSKTYRFALNAAYPGRFILPAVYCEAMYDNAVKAASPGKWVEVTSDQIKIAKAGMTGE